MTTRQQTAKNAVEASRFEGRGNPVSPWKDQSLFSTVNGGVLKNSLVVGTPGKPKVKVQETARVKVETIEPLVNAAYVLKSKNDKSGYLFDVLRPTFSPPYQEPRDERRRGGRGGQRGVLAVERRRGNCYWSGG